MSNALIGYYNRVDAGTLTGGSWAATLPRANLQNRIVAKVARSTDATLASTKFDIDIGADKVSRVAALIGHNFSLAAKYRLRCGTDATFVTNLFDSGWVDVWPPVYNSTDLDWQALNWWSGKYLAEEIAGITWQKIIDLGSAMNARYWRFEIDDTTNTAGYVEIGRLFIGPAWQPTINMSYGAGIGWEDKTEVQEALSGAEFFDQRRPYRVAQFQTGFMETDEGFSRAFEIHRRSGVHEEVLFVWDPDDTIHAVRRQFMGRLRQLSPIEYPYDGLDRTKTAWEIKELL